MHTRRRIGYSWWALCAPSSRPITRLNDGRGRGTVYCSTVVSGMKRATALFGMLSLVLVKDGFAQQELCTDLGVIAWVAMMYHQDGVDVDRTITMYGNAPQPRLAVLKRGVIRAAYLRPVYSDYEQNEREKAEFVELTLQACREEGLSWESL